MKIAVASMGETLDSNVSEHFGRCPYYIIVDGDDVHAVKNPYVAHSPGQVPEFIKSLGADVIISGGMGRRAIEIFKEMGIRALTGARGTVRDAIKNIDNLKSEPCERSEDHA